MPDSKYYEFLSTRGLTFHPIEASEVEGLVDLLQAMKVLETVPREELRWLVHESRIFTMEPGEFVRPGEIIEDMWLLFEGEVHAYTYQNGQKKVQATSPPGIPTGFLPFSRMKGSPVFVEVVEPIRSLSLHKSKFPELVAKNYELTEAIVHSMTDRVRHFSAMHFQNEKLMSLGKLSAGIAHEMNNPAAAIVRSAEDLKQSIGTLETKLRATSELVLSSEEIASLIPILDRAKVPASRLSLLERKRHEQELTDWLEDRNLSGEDAEAFLNFGYTSGDLDSIQQILSERSFRAVVPWLAASLREQRSIEEIGTAARRISELVKSVKSYTRMDQVEDMQELCINDGIRNTITMLQHKMRKNNVDLHEDLATGLPLILGFPGELNQVWTNIIDNALDAMKSGGELAVTTATDAEHVIFSVVDSGSGISPENLERIFDPFFTTKDVGEGTGVGLDVVQKVVSNHKGTIKVRSKPGRTEFRIAFPRSEKKA